MLRRVSGERRIVIGSQVANREDPLADALVGPIANSITLCFDVDDTLTKSEFIKQSTESIQAALEHQSLPAEAACAGRPPHSINLVVQRAYSDVSESESDAQPFRLIAVPSLAIGALWDLNFFMIRRAEGWRISCEANAELYDEATTDLLLSHWRASLEALVRAPDEHLEDCHALRRISPRAPAARSPATRPPAGAPPWRPRREATPVEPSRLVVRFNETGSRTPVIALNNRSVYFPLAKKLGGDRPFIDIQLYHPDGPFDLPRRAFEDFAADAVRLIRWAQPKGPYILCGHCVYGALAFEAARQLQREGEEVSLVALFDTRAPGFRETLPLPDKLLCKLQLRLHRYATKIRQFARGEINVRDLLWLPILRRLGIVPHTPPAEGWWFDRFLIAAVADYRPNAHDGDVLFVRSAEMLRGRLFDPRAGWGRLVKGEFRFADVVSPHLEMLSPPYVDAVADALSRFLADIEGH
jgi:thioesterase domain-containing protein